MKTFAIFTTVLISVLTPQMRAQDQDECSNGSMRGQYSFVASGTVNGSLFATTGYGIYDGHGNVQGVIQASLNGNVLPATGWSGTYKVSAMTAGTTSGGPTVCVLNKTIIIPAYNNLAVGFFVTAAKGFRDLRFIATTLGTTVSGTATKE